MIGERFNFEDVFFRDLTVCVLDTLEGEIRWVNKFSSGDRVINVPFYYSLTGDERFILDSFTDDVVSNNRYVDLNTDIIPRGHLTLMSYEIRADEFANPNVWLKMVVENDVEVRNLLTKVRAIPITVRYELKIHLSSEIDTFKCSQAILDTLWLYRFMYFEYNFMNIDAVMTIPDSSNIEIVREKNLTSDNTIKLTVAFDVQTYYPSFRKPKLPDILSYPITTDFNNKTLSIKIDLFKPKPEYFLEVLAKCKISFLSVLPQFTNISLSIDYPISNTVILSNFTFSTSTILDQVNELSAEINNSTPYSAVTYGNTIGVTAPSGSNNLINGKVITVGANQIDVDEFAGGDSKNVDEIDIIYSETHSITTSSNGSLVLQIGAGSSTAGNYLSLDLSQGGVKINVGIDVNNGNDFEPYQSGDDVSPPSSNNSQNLNQSFSNSVDFDFRDVIISPKRTRWYQNLLTLRGNRKKSPTTLYQSQDLNNQTKI